jgi:hypothetical protein
LSTRIDRVAGEEKVFDKTMKASHTGERAGVKMISREDFG